MAGKKSWSEKLEDSKDLPRVEKITAKMSKRWGTGTIVIPAPREVDETMRRVPEGKVTMINEIRAVLARKHKATICCPITTGIFARIAAGAAEEQRGKRKDLTPYWRTLSRRRDKREVSRRSRRPEKALGEGRTHDSSERQETFRSQLRKSFRYHLDKHKTRAFIITVSSL